MDAQVFEKISKRIDGYRDEMIDMQKNLIPLKAISPKNGGKGEFAKAKYLEPIIKGIFDSVAECNAPDKDAEGGIRPNYIAVMKGKNTKKTLWFMAHMDVVPEGETKLWNTDPFIATVKDGKIYGRGSEDNNQAIVSSIFAIKALKDEKIVPPINVGLLLVADEEMGSDLGAKYLLEKQRNIFGSDDMVIVPDSGDKEGITLEVAEKATVWLKITTKGKQSHAANPHQGVNAHRVAANFIVKMDQFYKKYSKKDPVFNPPSSTFEPTKKENNVQNVNTLPGEDVVYFDCRLLPEIDCEKFIGEVRQLANEVGKEFNATISVEINHLQKAAPPTKVDCELVKVMEKAVLAIHAKKGKPIGIGGNTVAQQFREIGLPVVSCSILDDTLHQPNEYCLIDNMVKDSKVWGYAILQY